MKSVGLVAILEFIEHPLGNALYKTLHQRKHLIGHVSEWHVYPGRIHQYGPPVGERLEALPAVVPSHA